ncbi:hypothetical protein HY989_01645 [Candidatus Micrarchaeota archaeon]|nr:hypothetical protein [Candidatus Micrarchaeota archaeon]
MKSHQEINEKAFSKNLDDLKEAEKMHMEEILKAQRRKEAQIAGARESILKTKEEEDAEILDEKKKTISQGIKEIDRQAAQIMEKAEKEAQKIRDSSSSKKIAEKLLPIIIE